MLWRLVFATAVLAYFYVGVRPHAAPPPPGDADLVYHALLNAVLTIFAYRAFANGRPPYAALVGLGALGGLIELVQTYSPNREPSFADFGADVAGILLAATAFAVLPTRAVRS